ncbi:MAG: hypothetical protein NTV33_11375 [Coprothermobacterota bacterium]|nr:hypothetical protein [Coprothermobacterota bacterium]
MGGFETRPYEGHSGVTISGSMRPQEYKGLTIPGTAAPQCGNSGIGIVLGTETAPGTIGFPRADKTR